MRTPSRLRFAHALMAASLFALVCACSSTARAARPLSVDDVIRSATSLEGQTVVVKGYLRFGDDGKNLWASKSAYLAVSGPYVPPNDAAWSRCITLFDIGTWRSGLLARNNEYVLIAGVLHRGPSLDDQINFDSCSDLGISIRSVNSPGK